jgi:hypothetical protein
MSIVKKVCYSGAILVLIIAATLLSSHLQNSKEKKKFNPFFPQFVQNVGKIVLTQGGETAILYKENGKWFVATGENPEKKYTADSVKAISIADKIGGMKQNNFVGSNKNNFEKYGFEDDSTFFVQIFDYKNKQIGNFILGKKSENWRENYFRKIGDNNVYLVGGGIAYAFKSDANEYRVKKLFDFNAEDITQIKMRYDDKNFTITKDSSNNWINDDSTSVEVDLITNLIAEFAELEANTWDYSYSVTDEISGLDSPTAQYEITLKDESALSLVVGNLDGDRPRFFVKVNDNPQVAFIMRSVIMRLKLHPNTEFKL